MYALFDIGGTKTRVAITHDGITFGEPIKFDTPKEFETGMDMVSEAINKLADGEKIEACGGGIPGPVDNKRTMLVNSPNLTSWIGKSVTDAISDRVGAKTCLENDSAVVALGEAHYGAGVDDPIMAYITVSTGIGGARIVDGKIDQSTYGFEPGHQYIDFDKSVCPECKTADSEDYISGTATEHRFHMKPYEVTDAQVWEDLSLWLAYLLNNTIVHWSPSSVVLGGSMMVGNPAIPIERVAYHLDSVCKIFPKKPILKKAKLADLGGLYGALQLVHQFMAK